MRLKRKCSALIALLLILAGCVLRFAMPGHDYLGYLLWGVAVLVLKLLHEAGLCDPSEELVDVVNRFRVKGL